MSRTIGIYEAEPNTKLRPALIEVCTQNGFDFFDATVTEPGYDGSYEAEMAHNERVAAHGVSDGIVVIVGERASSATRLVELVWPLIGINALRDFIVHVPPEALPSQYPARRYAEVKDARDQLISQLKVMNGSRIFLVQTTADLLEVATEAYKSYDSRRILEDYRAVFF